MGTERVLSIMSPEYWLPVKVFLKSLQGRANHSSRYIIPFSTLAFLTGPVFDLPRRSFGEDQSFSKEANIEKQDWALGKSSLNE